MNFGGLGGCPGGREFNETDLFEVAVANGLGDWLREDQAHGAELWSALANVDWEHKADGHTAGYSFRAAGDLIAAVVGEGEYMDYYCAGPEGVVSGFIEEELGALGWTVMDDELAAQPKAGEEPAA